MFNVIIRNQEPIRVACVRKVYRNREEALTLIESMEKLFSKSVLGKRRVIINYETEHRECDFDLGACVEINASINDSTLYEERILSFSSEVASLVCDVSELDDAYKSMLEYINDNNYQIIGANYEIYHNDTTVELKVPVFLCSADTAFEDGNIDMEFFDDPDVVGKWKMIDILPSKEQFLYGKPKCSHPAWLHEIFFIEGGKPYWSIAGWTKGYLFTYISHRQKTLNNKYTIENYDGRKLLFLEMKHYCDGNGIYSGMPEIWVYEKVNETRYYSSDAIRKEDNIDYPFIIDESVIGKWIVRDFVINADDFDPGKQNCKPDELFVKQLEVLYDGKYNITVKNDRVVSGKWTKGLLLNEHEKTASSYKIVNIHDKEYLIMEWKSGDYVFGGGRINYYIFAR